MCIAFSVSAYSRCVYMRCAVTRNVGSLVCVTMGAIKMSSQLHVVGTYIQLYDVMLTTMRLHN